MVASFLTGREVCWLSSWLRLIMLGAGHGDGLVSDIHEGWNAGAGRGKSGEKVFKMLARHDCLSDFGDPISLVLNESGH